MRETGLHLSLTQAASLLDSRTRAFEKVLAELLRTCESRRGNCESVEAFWKKNKEHVVEHGLQYAEWGEKFAELVRTKPRFRLLLVSNVFSIY